MTFFFFSQQFLPKSCMHVSSPPACHKTCLSYPSWPQWYLTRTTNFETLYYADFSGLPPLSLRFKRLSRRPTFEHLLKIESDLPYILIIHLLLYREQSLFLLQRTIGYLLLVSEIMLVSSKHHIKHIITPFRKFAKTFNVEAAGMYVYIVTAEF